MHEVVGRPIYSSTTANEYKNQPHIDGSFAVVVLQSLVCPEVYSPLSLPFLPKPTMSLTEVLDRIRARLAAVDPAGPRKCTGSVLIQLSNDQQWTMDLDALRLVEGALAEGGAAPNATVGMDDETFVDLCNRRLDVEAAKADGRIRISGDAELLAALRECSQEN